MKTLELNTLDGRKIEVELRDFTVIEMMRLGQAAQKAQADGDHVLCMSAMYDLVKQAAQSWKGARKKFSDDALDELLQGDILLIQQVTTQVGNIVAERFREAGFVPDVEVPEDSAVH